MGSQSRESRCSGARSGKEEIMLGKLSTRREKEVEDKRFVIQEIITENTKLKFIEVGKAKEINALDFRLKEFVSEKQRLEQMMSEANKTIADKDANVADLNGSISMLSSEKQRLEQMMSEANKTIADKDANIAGLNGSISMLSSEKQHLEDNILKLQNKLAELEISLNVTKEALSAATFQKDELSKLLMKSQENEQAAAKKIEDILNSETYRFIVLPIWKAMNFIKTLVRKDNTFSVPTFKIFYRRIFLILIVATFVIFIVFPMKIKKIFTR